MVQTKLKVAAREPADRVRILELQGSMTRSAEEPLLAAYQEATSGGAETVILNFAKVGSMDSSGLGLLFALQACALQQKQRLAACELSAPLQHALQLTYLDQALDVYADEAEALQSL